MKNSPTIAAAGPKPPRLAISEPAISGPRQEMKRGALKQNATAVPRIRVGNSSGNQTGAQAQIPSVKKPKTPTKTSSGYSPHAAPHRYTSGVSTRHIAYHSIVVGFRPIASESKPRLTK